MLQEVKDKKRIRLMGLPAVFPPERSLSANIALEICEDSQAMELLALLVLGQEFLLPHWIKQEDKATMPLLRGWLASTIDRSSFKEMATPKEVRDRVSYLLDKLHPRQEIVGKEDLTKVPVPIRVHSSQREPVAVPLTWANVSIDLLAIREAAKQVNVRENQLQIIALAEKPLLSGMTYAWLKTPPFQRVRAGLDSYYLEALIRQADSIIIRMEKADEAGRDKQYDELRSEVLPLLDKVSERLGGYANIRQPEYAVLVQFDGRFAALCRRANCSKEVLAIPPAVEQLPRIPRQITKFFARESEIVQLKSLLKSVRLITLTGMGGSGKTRLAVETAVRLQESSSVDIRMAELAPLTDSSGISSAIANALGLERKDTDTVISYLQGKPLILLLDNCEHLIHACAELVEKLLQSCVDLKILATSREPLKIDGEHLVQVSPLDVPDLDALSHASEAEHSRLLGFDSVRLFVDRISARRKIELNAENLRAIAAICAGLDGIPLALEFAAARVKILSLPEINEMLSDRFKLLIDGKRTALARHKTLRAVLDWSYDLLNDDEKIALCRLSVFAGGWTVEAGEAVATNSTVTDSFALITSLVDKSLVIADFSEPTTRYKMLETVRQYGQDLLREHGEWDQTRSAHREYFLTLAEVAEPKLRGPDQKRWLDRLETEHDNLRMALAWQSDEMALRLACALQRFWWVRGYAEEGRKWIEHELENNSEAPAELRAKALVAAGRFAFSLGRYMEAKTALEEGLELSLQMDNHFEAARAQQHLGHISTTTGDYHTAKVLHEASLEQFRRTNDIYGVADALASLAILDQNQGNYAAAEEKHNESLTLRREIQDSQGIADSLMSLGNLALRRGEVEEADRLLQESLTLFSSLTNWQRMPTCLTMLGRIALAKGNVDEAEMLFQKTRDISRKCGSQWDVAQSLNYLGEIARDRLHYVEAEAFYRKSLEIMKLLGAELAVAILLGNLGNITFRIGRHSEAQSLFRESLDKLREHKDRESGAAILEEYAALLAASVQSERAIRIWGHASALSAEIGFLRPANEDARYNDAVAMAREALGEELFASAWAEGQAMTWEQAVAYVLESDLPRPASPSTPPIGMVMEKTSL